MKRAPPKPALAARPAPAPAPIVEHRRGPLPAPIAAAPLPVAQPAPPFAAPVPWRPAPAPEPPPSAEPAPAPIAPAPPPPRIADGRNLPGCEALRDRQNQNMDLTRPRAPTANPGWQERARALLADGRYLAHCGLGARSALTLCTAVEQGRVVGVSVTTDPASARVDACVRRAVAGLSFTPSAELEVFTTYFAPLR
jgi:hypothetical protein